MATENDWIFDAIYAFFQSARWQTPVQSFIEENCVFFLGAEDEKVNMAQEHKDIHKQFTKLIDSLMQSLLSEIGIDQKQFLKACQAAKNNKNHWKIVKQILLVDDFGEFKKIMVKRNKDLERKALSLMLQNEERQLQKYMKDKGIVSGKPIQTKGGKQYENSFSSSGEEESSSESDDEEDESLRMALKLSKEQEKIDQQKKLKADPGMAQYQNCMSETDGFKLAMELSKAETGGAIDSSTKTKKSKPTPGGVKGQFGAMNLAEDEMEAMMQDTAGFNKILEQSKKDEEARIAKAGARANAEKETDIALRESVDFSQMQKKLNTNQETHDQEQIQMAMQLSSQATQLEEAKMSQEELQVKLVMEASAKEAKHQAELQEQNDKLLKIMQDLDEEKPEGWGFSKGQDVAKGGDVLADYEHNIAKAIKRLEMDEKRKQYGAAAPQKKAADSDKILEATKTNANESMEERRLRLQAYKDKMIEARNAERKHELMKTSFTQLQDGAEAAENTLQQQQEQQKNKLDEAIKRRNQMRATALGFGAKAQKKPQEDEDSDQEVSMVKDDYDGTVVLDQAQSQNILDLDERPKVLDDGFMGQLKLEIAEVPDSDDECYF